MIALSGDLLKALHIFTSPKVRCDQEEEARRERKEDREGGSAFRQRQREAANSNNRDGRLLLPQGSAPMPIHTNRPPVPTTTAATASYPFSMACSCQGLHCLTPGATHRMMRERRAVRWESNAPSKAFPPTGRWREIPAPHRHPFFLIKGALHE